MRAARIPHDDTRVVAADDLGDSRVPRMEIAVSYRDHPADKLLRERLDGSVTFELCTPLRPSRTGRVFRRGACTASSPASVLLRGEPGLLRGEPGLRRRCRPVCGRGPGPWALTLRHRHCRWRPRTRNAAAEPLQPRRRNGRSSAPSQLAAGFGRSPACSSCGTSGPSPANRNSLRSFTSVYVRFSSFRSGW